MSHDPKYDAAEFTDLAFACNECGRPVPEGDAGPSCGAHLLHIECGPWFHCDHCYQIRAEVP